jgi:hypothetical protein
MTLLVNLTASEPRALRSLCVGGVLFDAGLDVYRWTDPTGFNGYMTERCEVREQDRKTGKEKITVIKGRRYGIRAWTGDPMRKVRQIMVHHSGGDGRNPSGMFETLWRVRGLSVHFAVEDDGRVFQFLDPEVVAWHGGAANGRSVGIECCLYPTADLDPDYYSPAACARRGNLPHRVEEEVLQGARREVFVMPDVQIEALARLCAALWIAAERHMPPAPSVYFLTPPRFPRPGPGQIAGDIPTRMLPWAPQHVGLVAHMHYTVNKWDPAGLAWYRFEDIVATRFSEFRANLKEVA